jgi:hypothetical protein
MKKVLATGKVKVFDWRAYRCNRLAREGMHDRSRIKRCRNSTVATHILEGTVFDMIRDVMFDPAKLRRCMDESAAPDDRGIAGELARIAEALKALDEKRRGMIEAYVTEQMPGDEYIAEAAPQTESLTGSCARGPGSSKGCDFRSMTSSWPSASGNSARTRRRDSRRARTSIHGDSSSWITSSG